MRSPAGPLALRGSPTTRRLRSAGAGSRRRVRSTPPSGVRQGRSACGRGQPAKHGYPFPVTSTPDASASAMTGGVVGDPVSGSGVPWWISRAVTASRTTASPFAQSFEAAAEAAHREPPVPGGDPRQDGPFLRRGERPSGGRPSRAPARLPPSPGRRETPVRSDSAGVASPFPAADDGSAHLPGTHRGHRFGTDSGRFQSVRTATGGRSVALEGPRHHHRIVHRLAGGQALPEHLGGRPLRHLAERRGIHRQAVLRSGPACR